MWLAEDWWLGLVTGFKWPNDVKTLAADRKAKGFSVITLTAGLYPDMAPLDPRCANEGGLPWESDFARINPAFYDAADHRISHFVRTGLVPCITRPWGYYLPTMGMEKMKRHWRYLVARYAAMPVVCSRGRRSAMPFYLSKTHAQDAAFQKKGWGQISHYLADIDPYHNVPRSIPAIISAAATCWPTSRRSTST